MTGNVRVLEIEEIKTLKELQFRKIDPGTVRRYAEAYAAGAEMPPVKVALFNGQMLLVDGWHRLAALRKNNDEFVAVHVVEAASLEDAKWQAARANLSNGLPLTNKQVREVFRTFMRTGQWKKGSRGKMSLREIEKVIGKPHTTIRDWMRKDFPRITKKHYVSGSEKQSDKWGGLRFSTRVTPFLDIALTGIKEIRTAFDATSDLLHRGEIIVELEEALAEMRKAEWKEPEPEDF